MAPAASGGGLTMDVREKLIELQMQAKIGWTKGQFADYLISNGVTVKEWISVKDRVPKDGVRVLALHDDGIIRIGISRGYFPSIVSRTNTKSFGIAEVTHWMPLPQPPKGE